MVQRGVEYSSSDGSFYEEEEEYLAYSIGQIQGDIGGLQPYQDEPEIRGGEEESSRDHDDELDLDHELLREDAVNREGSQVFARLGDPNLWWCKCGECDSSTLEKEEEHTCCTEFKSIEPMLIEGGK